MSENKVLAGLVLSEGWEGGSVPPPLSDLQMAVFSLYFFTSASVSECLHVYVCFYETTSHVGSEPSLMASL